MKNMLHVEFTDRDLVLPDLPEAVANHPGMISKQERQLLYCLAKDRFEGRGRIVDAGTFLGASTCAFTLGMHDGDRRKLWKNMTKPIISFERAIVSGNFERHVKKHGLQMQNLGDSFEPLLRDLLAPYETDVELVIGDILEYDGSDLGDIEICFLDILKAPPITRHCLQIMFPKLLVGSYVIHQDYYFHDLPDIKVNMEAFADHFIYLGEVRSSALFKLKKRLDAATIAERLKTRPISEQLQLHALAEKRTNDPARQYLMQLSRALLLADAGELDQAKNIWKQADEKYHAVAFDENGGYKKNIQWRINFLQKRIGQY